MQRLTREQAAVLTLYTGVVCGPFEDAHALASVFMPGILTIEFADGKTVARLKEKVEPLFLALCAQREQDHRAKEGGLDV